MLPRKNFDSPFGGLVIFLGICTLGLIAFPFFLNTTYTLCGSVGAEAKTYVGSMNRAQQAYFLEKEAFSNSLADLGLGIKNQTENFQYSTRVTKTSAFNYGIPRRDYGYKYKTEGFWPFEWQKKTEIKLKGYVGGVFVVPETTVDPKADKKEITTVAIMCEAVSPGKTKLADPIMKNGKPICPDGTKQVGGK